MMQLHFCNALAQCSLELPSDAVSDTTDDDSSNLLST
jgi:hypothetical protein